MITPDQLAKSGTEHGHQAALFCWASIAALHGFEIAWKFAEIGQAAFLGTTRPNVKAVPELRWMFAIPNGAVFGDSEKSRAIRAGKMKAEGLRNGVADVFLPVPRRISNPHPGEFESALGGYIVDEVAYCGLFIEMKKPELRPKRDGKGGVSEDQEKFGVFAKEQGYGWVVCYDWREAAKMVEDYLKWNPQ